MTFPFMQFLFKEQFLFSVLLTCVFQCLFRDFIIFLKCMGLNYTYHSVVVLQFWMYAQYAPFFPDITNLYTIFICLFACFLILFLFYFCFF